MEEKSFTERLHEQIEQYARTTVELYKLKAANTMAGVFSSVATGFILWVFFLLILLFVSIGAAFYFGHLFGAWHYGFFTVAGIYILFAVIIYIYRVKCLKERIANFIVKQIFED